MTDHTYIQEAGVPTDELIQAISEVMEIYDTTAGWEDYVLRARGILTIESETAYTQLEGKLHPLGFTPLFRMEGEKHVVLLTHGVAQPKPSNPSVNIVLFAITLVSVLFAGSLQGGGAVGEIPFAEGADFSIWPVVRMLWTGWPFAASLLGILLAHEMGHYFAARWHGAPVTLPYFIPLPTGFLGTMGAVIRMKAPIRNRRALLDIGVAGPLAGLVVALPVVIVGLELSEVSVLPTGDFLLEGNSILYLLAKLLVHGEFLPKPDTYGGVSPLLYWVVFFFTGQPAPLGGVDVLIHPVALAGWAGLLVTGLNLIPAGQLDGGHVLYVLIGRTVSKWQPLIIGGLILLGLVWRGWWFWAVLIYMFGRQHPQLLDEITPLDPRRRNVALGTLLLFIFVIVPIPLQVY
ncbi:MAG: site-2 protease family protein [Anaerolineales bacterium]|nr:site-2 protease family protein [Anaerolineales bacterium]